MFQVEGLRFWAVLVIFCRLTVSVSGFYPRVYNDMVISRNIFNVQLNLGWLECIEFCMKDKACISYNYDVLGTKNHTCELSNCGGMSTKGCSMKSLRFSKGFVHQQLKEHKDFGSCDDVRSQVSTPALPSTHKDCADVMRSGEDRDGLYVVDPDGRGRFTVQCDQVTDGGGWIVIQRRFDGRQTFYLNWKDYCDGFGSLGGEFWLGLDRIHRLTAKGNTVLRIELKSARGSDAYALYENFNISTKETKFKLHATFSKGTAGDSLKKHTGHSFSTKDQDDDLCTDCSCAERFKSAWWYDGKGQSCVYSDLNGKYKSGISWSTWFYRISETRMMIRPDNN